MDDSQISLADELLMAIEESEQTEQTDETTESAAVTEVSEDDYENQPSAEDDIQIDEI